MPGRDHAGDIEVVQDRNGHALGLISPRMFQIGVVGLHRYVSRGDIRRHQSKLPIIASAKNSFARSGMANTDGAEPNCFGGSSLRAP